MKAQIFDIKHFAVHDGPGIRTTVFFKGCHLRCLWCHNPEGISSAPQLGYLAHKCTGCGKCVAVCPSGAHKTQNGYPHIFDRAKCIQCGRCAEVCLERNLILYGKEVSLEAVFQEVIEDRDFYDASGGGITLSGGECLNQADFCEQLLKRLKQDDIHTAVDTCGFVSKASLHKVLPYTDLFLYDIKAFDEDVHIHCTGTSNRIILENLKYLDDCGASAEIRIPYVPGYNSDQLEKIGCFLKDLKHLTGVRILPYHNFAATKYASLGLQNHLPPDIPSQEALRNARQILLGFGLSIQE